MPHISEPKTPPFRAGAQCRLLAIVAALAAAACARSAAALPSAPPVAVSDSVIALVGGTVIDGNGGVPLSDATIVIVGDRITKVGPRATTAIPPGAWQIDVRGKYLTPGLIDCNVHIYGDPLGKAKEFLGRGVTTVRDTHAYGNFPILLTARDSLQRGGAIGARLLVAGDIIGVGEGSMGHDLVGIDADSLRPLIDHYLDQGGDILKIAVTDHDASDDPQPLLFSPRALEMMVQEAHQRGKVVDSHTNTPEGLRMAVLAGVDVLQHPEALQQAHQGSSHDYPMSSDLANLVAARHVVCSLMIHFYIGNQPPNQPWRPIAVENARMLMRSGCLIAVATDVADARKTLLEIEDLVALGMTPAQALTAATRNGAIAAGALREYGTLEVGKRADVLVLGANPLADIHNIEKMEIVLHHGYVIDQSGKKLQEKNP